MKRIVCYFDPEWAFGSIHYELIKQLSQYQLDAVMLPWSTPYSNEEMAELDAVTDVFMTNPHGYHTLRKAYNIPVSKLVVVAHAVLDLHQLIESNLVSDLATTKGFAVVSEFLRDEAIRLGISPLPPILPLGINLNRYTAPAATKLRTVGLAGSFERIEPHTGSDIKRGELAKQVVERAGLKFVVAESYHHSFVTMAGFYPTVDAVIVASTEEGAGLPALEAAAAGRLVISTPVGHWPERSSQGGGETVPIEAEAFEAKVLKLLQFYKANPDKFHQRCVDIQKHAASYDWGRVIDRWVDFLDR